MPDCPDDTVLAGFLNDSLAPDQGAHVSGHVDGCPMCQARLDRLTEETGGAVARYRELPSVDLPDARSGGAAVTPDADTQVVGARPVIAVFGGPPPVPGFEVLGEIGRGGMGVVFKARHRRLNRLVALKMILAGASDARAVQRFLFEGEVLARVQHPQVVTVFEVGTYEGPNRTSVPYLAMELLEGGTLSRRLREAQHGPAPGFVPRAAAELLEGLARAVHAAHLQGVVHRDLKPGNILFGKDEPRVEGASAVGPPSSLHSSPLPKVTDFGLAKFTQDSGAELTQTGQILGTPAYMAPEQAAGGRRVGPAADVYALGAILFECLAGRPPFTGSEPMSVMLRVVNEPPPDVRGLRPDVPRDLAAVTAKCLAKEPGRRYASAEELADDLRRFLDGRPTKARPVTNLERLWFSARRNPAVAGLLAALAVTLTVGFVAVAALWARAEGRAETEERLRRDAQAERKTAHDAREQALAEVKQRQRHEAQLEFARAVEWCEDGRVADGLELFVRALELAEQTDDAALVRVIRINLAAWGRDLPKPARRFQHTEQPRLVAFHPDGKHMLSAGRGRELYLWELGTGKRVRTYRAHRSATAPATFDPFGVTGKNMAYWTVGVSPDGSLVAAGGSDGTVTLWETSPGGPAEERPLANFRLPDPQVPGTVEVDLWTLAFTGPRVLWTNDGANGLRRWDLTDPKRPTSKRFVPAAGAAHHALQILVASPDGRTLYTGDRVGHVRVWDDQGNERRNWALRGWITDLAVSPDGTRVAATGTDGVVSVLDATGDPKDDLRGEKRVLELSLAGAYGNGVAYAPTRPYLVASDGDGNVRFWHRDTGQPVGLVRQFHGEVTRMRFRPNSPEFAVPAGDSVHLCTVPAPPGELLWLGRNARLRGLDVAPDGGSLAIADNHGCGLLDLRTGARREFTRDDEAVTVRFDPDPARPRMFRGVRTGFDVFAAPAGARTAGDSPYRAKVSRIDFTRDGRGVYALASLAVVRYNAGALERTAIRRPAEKLPAGVELSALAVRPDGGEVFVSFGDSAAVLKGDTLEPLREWAIGDEVLDARYTPDGSKILLGRRTGAAELRDARTGERVGPQMPHWGAITGVAVTPNGAVLVTASRDGTARFWDAATGLPLGPSLTHAGPVTHVACVPDGTRVATGTGAGHITLWNVPPPPLADTVDELQARFGPKE